MLRRLSQTFALLTAVATLVSLAPTAQANPPARSEPERRASLIWLLASTRAELSRATLDGLGPETQTMLIDIANGPRQPITVRMRALAGLGYYRSEDSYAYLSSLLNERTLIGTPEGLKLRRQAIRSLGWGFGDRAVDDILALKSDSEAGIRQAVAAALGESGSQRVLPTLELWLTTEPDFTVRDAVDKAVNQLNGR